jgi:outer membrane autotransporter protein
MNNNLSNTQIKTAVQTMKPEITNSSIGAIAISNGSLSTVSNYLQVARIKSAKQGISTGDESANKNVWIQGFSTTAKQDDVDGKSGYDSKGNGVVIGFDKNMEFDTTYGIAISFGTSDITGNSSLTNTSTDVISKQLTLYFSRNFYTSYIEGYISKGWNDNSSQRDIILGTDKRTAYSSYGSTIKTMKLAYGNNIKVSRFIFTPNGSITSSMVSTDTYTETGASGADLTVDTKDLEKVTTLLGLKVSTKIDFSSGSSFSPLVRISYKKDFGDNYTTATSQFRDADYTFISDGLEVDDYAMVYGASLKYKSASGMSEYKIDVETTQSEHYVSNIGSFTARFKF